MPEQIVETVRLLIVSRESTLLTPVWSISEANSWQVETATSGWDAIERIRSGNVPNIILLDVPRVDGECELILRSLRRINSNLSTILVCSPEDAGRNRNAIQLGVQEVLIKPLEEAQLERVIRQHIASLKSWSGEITNHDIEQFGPDSFFVAACPASQKLRTQVQVLADADVPVLILGEGGSGKDTVARLIHKRSIRSGFEFVKVNCADLPAEMLEAELFGNIFPYNENELPGRFEQANHGTIFFDEITELPLALQGKLMQIVQHKVLFKPGMSPGSAADFRLLAATSSNVDLALSEGRLREDLYCEISAFAIQVPPLRQRRNEIPVLAQHLMYRLSRQYGLAPRMFSPAAHDACRNYSWPGNLRELEKFVKRYLIVGDEDSALDGLRSDLVRSHEERALMSADPMAGNFSECRVDQKAATATSSSSKSLKSFINSVKSEAERNAIEIALNKTGWNRKAAARLLQVSYRTLLYKIDQYHMCAPQSYVAGFSSNGTNGDGKELK